jgi:hypothetical protein
VTHAPIAFRYLLLIAILCVAGNAPAGAQGAVYVLESTDASIRVGTPYGMTDRITVPPNATIRVVMPSGKTQTIRGPYSGTAAELAKGQRPNDGVMAWLKSLVQAEAPNEKTPGATRGMRGPAPSLGFSWTGIPTTADSSICVQKGAALQLLRASSQGADRVTVVDMATTERADVEFAAGSQAAPWPPALTPKLDSEYVLLAPQNRPRRQLTLRVLDHLPGEDDVLAELAAHDCRYQFDAWVKEKLAAGKRKGS